jgi:hypothetical protein
MTLRAIFRSGFVALLIAGCGNMKDDSILTDAALPALRGFIAPEVAEPPLQPVGEFPGVDPAMITGVTNPLMGLWIEPRGALATLAIAARNGDVVVWRSADSGTMGLADGVLVSTRGFVHDLHAGDPSQTRAALRSGQAAQVERLYVFIDTAYGRQELRAQCRFAPAGSETLTINNRRHAVLRFEEHCAAGEHQFTNIYWRDRSGPIVWQSRQWLGPDGGFINAQRLVE